MNDISSKRDSKTWDKHVKSTKTKLRSISNDYSTGRYSR
uniref:Uncharacterized protein n=1 Tax=Arundo donax TaxID=35708 RepID=A0A0A9EJ50_ARUDO